MNNAPEYTELTDNIATRENKPDLINAYEKDLLASQNSNQQGMLVRIRFPEGIRYHLWLLTELVLNVNTLV